MAAPISKKCSCTSPAPPNSRPSRRNERVLARPRLGDDAALSLYSAQLLAAHAGALVLADPAGADLGVHEPVLLAEQLLCRARLWRAARRGDAVGSDVPQSAWPVDLVSRGDVVAQSWPFVHDAAQGL